MKKDQLDLVNRTVGIPDLKSSGAIAEVPLTDIAVAFTNQLAISGPGNDLFPSDENASGHQRTFKTVWHATLRRAKTSYFRIYNPRSTYATPNPRRWRNSTGRRTKPVRVVAQHRAGLNRVLAQ